MFIFDFTKINSCAIVWYCSDEIRLLFQKLSIICLIYIFQRKEWGKLGNVWGSLIRNTEEMTAASTQSSFAFYPTDVSTGRPHFVTLQQTDLATVCAPNTADTDCQMNLDVTKADSMRDMIRAAYHMQTEKRTKAEIWAAAENSRFQQTLARLRIITVNCWSFGQTAAVCQLLSFLSLGTNT